MKEIKIVSRYDSSKVLLSGKYESVKDCLEKNRRVNLYGANLSGANLYRVNLSGANLSGVNLYGANLYGADLYGAYLSGADLSGANLYGADLAGANLSRANLSGAELSGAKLSMANLSGANLSRANLSRADLSGANLSGAKNYLQNHSFFIQLIRNNSNGFTKKQKEVASMIFAFKLCWKSIRKEYKTYATQIFKKLAELGWDEYEKYWITDKD